VWGCFHVERVPQHIDVSIAFFTWTIEAVNDTVLTEQTVLEDRVVPIEREEILACLTINGHLAVVE
jgi:hypothetical protein